MKSDRCCIVLYYEIVVGGCIADPLAARIAAKPARMHKQMNNAVIAVIDGGELYRVIGSPAPID